MIYVLKINHESANNRYQVTGYREFEHNVNIEGLGYIEVTADVYNYVVDNISANNIYYPDNPGVGTPGLNNLDLEAIDEVQKLANNAVNFLRGGELENRFSNDFYLTFMEYIMANTYFMSKGYFITEENREDIYLDILNSGDTELIAKLEAYLEVLDDIEIYRQPIDEYKTFKHGLRNATTVAEVTQLFKDATGREIADLFRRD